MVPCASWGLGMAALSARTPVVALFRCGRPSAILGAIGSVVVNTVKRMTRRWATAHIFKERSVARSPAFADVDASSSISVVSAYSRKFASAFHSTPNAIFGCAPRFSMLVVQLGLALSRKTSATRSAISSQSSALSNMFIAAIALAVPLKLTGGTSHLRPTKYK